jgi:ligand-binding sensor domain-containing protein
MDDAGRLWLSYSQTGIDIFDENLNLIRSYENIPGILPSSQLGEIFTIYKDSKSNIWLATYLNGLLKYNLEKIISPSTFREKDLIHLMAPMYDRLSKMKKEIYGLQFMDMVYMFCQMVGFF